MLTPCFHSIASVCCVQQRWRSVRDYKFATEHCHRSSRLYIAMCAGKRGEAAVIDGPPPGAFARLVRSWREYIAWWMIEKLSPPARTPKAKDPVEPPVAIKPYLNGDARDNPPSQRRPGEPLRRR